MTSSQEPPRGDDPQPRPDPREEPRARDVPPGDGGGRWATPEPPPWEQPGQPGRSAFDQPARHEQPGPGFEQPGAGRSAFDQPGPVGHPGQPGQPGHQSFQQPYGGPPPSYPPPYPVQAGRSGAQVLSIIGFVCAAVSVLFIPILFGLAGIVLGIVGHTRGESLGKWAAIASGICMVLGMVLGAVVLGLMRT
ncbi:DUF308 domain-containing protein [Nonomuraea pusilla]|uniref:DUF4190 domain-containing protein n=1 Tax=Nonomuraea pusilla TaxID=46177 RepID=A0A1H7WWU7_9ACTN|nr:DUF308 domain-containing protein [Nonomuraea pusilla]SEM25407.1 hypothetical protein SAMN05660976_04618 [Nonomuraea pusilla]